MRAASLGSIGVVLTNTAPLVAPTRGRARILGTNPIAVAAPAGDAGVFVLDMATSTVTWGRVLADARHDARLPDGVAIDSVGRATTVPREVLDGGALLGLGGVEATGGHKGYGLALAIDILTGVLAGAAFGSGVVPQWSKADRPSDLGQLFLAIHPRAIGDDSFQLRLQRYLEELRSSPRAQDSDGPVLVHGDPEADRAASQRATGITMSLPDHAALESLGDRLGIAFPHVTQYTRPDE
jgi:LDH2 family malate/lactate/ureidoglycolate dehydrogenase